MRVFAHKGFIFLSIAVILIIILVCVVIAPIYGYGQLEVEFDAQSSSLEFDVSVESVAESIFNVFGGNLIEAALSMVKGLKIQGEITFDNNAFIPLYVPILSHKVSIEGKQCPETIKTESMWIGPNGSESQQFSLLIQTKDLPEIAFSAFTQGGTVNIEIVSEIGFGAYSITKTTHKQSSISNFLSS